MIRKSQTDDGLWRKWGLGNGLRRPALPHSQVQGVRLSDPSWDNPSTDSSLARLIAADSEDEIEKTSEMRTGNAIHPANPAPEGLDSKNRKLPGTRSFAIDSRGFGEMIFILGQCFRFALHDGDDGVKKG